MATADGPAHLVRTALYARDLRAFEAVLRNIEPKPAKRVVDGCCFDSRDALGLAELFGRAADTPTCY